MNAAVLLLFKLLARLPLPLLHALGIALGWLIYWTPGRHSERMRNNLLQSGLCAPGRDCRRLLRQAISESGKSIVELLPVWLRPYESVLKLVKGTSGWERVDAELASGRGAILIGPHIGCFEIINLYYASQHPFTAMYKPPRKQVLAELMLAGRQRGQATLVPTDLSGVRAQLAALKRREAIGILPDQVATGGDGVPKYLAAVLQNPMGGLYSPLALDPPRHGQKFWCVDQGDGAAAEPGENIHLQSPEDLARVRWRPGGGVLGDPLTRNHLKTVCGAFSSRGLLDFAILAGVDVVCQQLSGLVTPYACILQADVWVLAQRQPLFFSIEAVLHSPELAA